VLATKGSHKNKAEEEEEEEKKKKKKCNAMQCNE